MLPEASDLAVNLISLFIIYDSNKRISAKEAIKHEYFFEKPFPATLEEMQRPKEKKLDMIVSARGEAFLLTLEALFIRELKPRINTKDEYRSRELKIKL